MTRISFISVGGTISMTMTINGAKPGVKAEDLIELVPDLSKIADEEIRCKQVISTDSANLQPHHWIRIVEAIYEEVQNPNVDGVVVAHGTDTMVYSLAATSFMLQNIGKPIVFTGAQIPLTDVGSDGRKNLLDAFRVATTTDIAEVLLVFDSKIFRGSRTRKLHAYALNAFISVDEPPLGLITRNIELLRSPLRTRNLNRNATIDTRINPSVALIKIYPGMKPSIFEALITEDIRGVVLEAYGEGNLPIEENSIIPHLAVLHSQEIPVVVTTQCIFGKSELIYYETGRKAYEVGAIPGFDLISEVALVKLMIAIARVSKFTKIKDFIHNPLAGEINPIRLKK